MLEGYRVGTYLCEVDVARWAGFYRVIIAEHEVVCFKGTFCHSLAIVPNKSLSLSLSLSLAGDDQTLEGGDKGVGPLSNSFYDVGGGDRTTHSHRKVYL